MNPILTGLILGILIPLAAPFAARALGYTVPKLLSLALGIAGVIIGLSTGTQAAIRQAVTDPTPEILRINGDTRTVTRGERLCLRITTERRGQPVTELQQATLQRAGRPDASGPNLFLNDPISRRLCPS